MYKLKKINEAVMTRTIELENEQTGTIDLCFDDSAVVSDINFDFMKIGQAYDCKIVLFGDIVTAKSDDSVSCKITNNHILVGEKVLVEVKINNDIYYLPKRQIENHLNAETIEFSFSRKDLIQVNDVIHADLL